MDAPEMSTGEPASSQDLSKVNVAVRDVHVKYELVSDRGMGLRQRLVTGAGPLRRDVHAVRGISLDVHDGDAIAVIGSNGSGKSTLLAAMAGVLPISDGEIWVRETPKLLGVGGTLMPTLSGRRNVHIGCLALGMSAEEAIDVAPSVIEFADIGDAIDRPLRTYSSGMRARLQFGIATSVRPKVLMVDEALAVGDRAFRRKCHLRIEAMLDSAGSLLLVSHSAADVTAMCRTAIWVDKGLIIDSGDVADVLAAYEKATN